MPFIGQTISDTFGVYDDAKKTIITGETFTGVSIFANGLSSNVSYTLVETPVTGFYSLSFVPTVTGQWYASFKSNGTTSAFFEGNYDVVDPGDVWAVPLTARPISGTFGGAVGEVYKITRGKWEMKAPNQLVLYDEDGASIIRQFNLFDLLGNASLTGVVKRVPI